MNMIIQIELCKSVSPQYKSKWNLIQMCTGIFVQTQDEIPDNDGFSSSSGHKHMENEFVYIVETALDKKTQKCLIKHVQMALI